MAAVTARPAEREQPDELDRLLDYDNAVEDFLKDIPIGDGNDTTRPVVTREVRDEDQEVQIKRKRNPAPKLDENRLLSDAGIPKLRKVAKSRLRFRGKGHEYSDMSRLLNTYQLWLDDLYPRAKFRDALAMVEKVGHSKRLQIMRKTWLDETKAIQREPTPDTEMFNASAIPSALENPGVAQDDDLFADMMRENAPEDRPRLKDDIGAPGEDELDALLAEHEQSGPPSNATRAQTRPPQAESHEPDEDELDALLAEQDYDQPQTKQKRQGPFIADDEPDELDMLMAEQDFGARDHDPSGPRQASKSLADDDFTAEEEVLAGMY